MKRCIKWLINWFVQWGGKLSLEEKIGFSFGAVAGLTIGIMLLVTIDTVSATPMDYKPLEEQMTAVQQNPQLLFETNCDIKVKDEVVTVLFENDECSITARYDKNLKITSYSKGDKSVFGLLAILLAVGVGVVAYCACGVIFTVLIYITEYTWKFISENILLKFRKATK